jgi:hypothetical protein
MPGDAGGGGKRRGLRKSLAGLVRKSLGRPASLAMLSEVGGEGGDAAEPGVLELMTDQFGQGRGNGTPPSSLTSVRGGAGRVSTSIDDATHAAALVASMV